MDLRYSCLPRIHVSSLATALQWFFRDATLSRKCSFCEIVNQGARGGKRSQIAAIRFFLWNLTAEKNDKTLPTKENKIQSWFILKAAT